MRRFEKCATATDTTKLPQRSTEQAAGYDFYSPVSITIGPKQKFGITADDFTAAKEARRGGIGSTGA